MEKRSGKKEPLTEIVSFHINSTLLDACVESEEPLLKNRFKGTTMLFRTFITH
jgi:hypothetical protein